jgi:tetratricopeptide (TPR) repeat protein
MEFLPRISTCMEHDYHCGWVWSFYAEAELLYKRSLAVTENALGSTHADVAASLNRLARLYVEQARYLDAEPLFNRALAIFESARGPDQPDVALALRNLALLYDSQFRYLDAETFHKRALAIFEKTLGPDHTEVAQSLTSLGMLNRHQGRYAEAEPLQKRALAIYEKNLGPNHPNVADVLTSLATLYTSQHRFLDAQPLYKRALEIGELNYGHNSPQLADTLSNVASSYQDQGNYADAEPLFKRALVILEKVVGPDSFQVGSLIYNLATNYFIQGRYTDAEPLYHRAREITEREFGLDHPELALRLDGLAELFQKEGRYSDAEPLYKRALTIYEKTLGPDHPDITMPLLNLASLYDAQARYPEALKIIFRTISQGVATKNITFPILNSSQEHHLIDPSEALMNSFSVLQRESSSTTGDAVSKLAARFAAGTDELAHFVRKDQDLAAEAAHLDKVIIAAVSKAPTERNATAEDQIRNRIETIKFQRNNLQSIFDQRFPEYVALSKPQPLSVEQTQALLADDEALVEFDFDAHSYAWLVTRTSAHWTALKITAKDLIEQVRQLRQSLTFDVDKPFDASLSYKIYQETFGSIAEKLQDKKRLSVVTNGALTSLPLQLLVTRDPSGKSLKDIDWLVRSYAITVLPSIYSLKTLRAQSAMSAAHSPMIAFADPIFSKDEHKRVAALRSVTNFYEGGKPDLVSLARVLPELPETEAEVRAIADVMNVNTNDLKFGTEASVTTVKKRS